MSIQAISPAFEIVEGLRVAQVDPADTARAIDALRARPDVLYAEPNFIRRATVAPNDPRYPEMWGLNNTGQRSSFGGHPGTPGNDIRAEQAWNIITGNRSVVVGVIDTGIDVNHEDLRDNIWTNPAETPGNGIDDDGNGFVDDINGWDFAHNDASVFDYTEPTYPPAETYTGDLDDHGTHVAGTIGASGNNALGVTGVNWQVSLMSLKFLTEDGTGSSSRLLNAFAYAKAMRQLWESSNGTKGANIRVLNNSYGGDGFSQAELDAIRALGDAGILFVVSAGNESTTNDLFPVYPSNYLAANLISVAASSGGGSRATFSNSGEATVNITAPGEYILSTTPKNTYNFANGTSMSAPHVSGSAALVCAQFPNITVQRLRSVIMYGAHPAPWQYMNVFPLSTGNSVDAGKALQAVNSADVTPPGPVTALTAQINDTFPNYRLTWQPSGDDGNVGPVSVYEIRYSDVLPKDANWDLATPLPGPVPNTNPPSTHFHNVRIPWRHHSGFIGIRAVDDVGNKGPIVSVPVSVSVDVGDPYTVSESATAPLSTGGTPLGLIGDDEFKTINLPFNFAVFGFVNNSITVSTNGALYFGFPPDHDAFSSERWLTGRRMIAGLWDDLRTDRRAGDDVYTIQNDDRIIFRWQAVTFDTPISPTETRGENPVNFEIELRFDGTITVRYGDGNVKTLPVVGISGGSPEPYISTSHTSPRALKDLTNAATVVFARRSPIQRAVLTVASSAPNSGVNVTVSPNDVSGAGNGTTQFTRTYNNGTNVTITAPATVNGNLFTKWQRDGQDWATSPSISQVMERNHTFTAFYTTPPVLTVTSSNPNSGVNIAVAPLDKDGLGNGATPFTRTFDLFMNVNLTAPATAGGNTFWKWQLDGVDYSSSLTATVSMNSTHTVKAVYFTATPTPTPTPVPGAGTQPIVFVKPGSSPGSGNDLFLTNTDGANIVNLTNMGGDDTRPTWSPDGSRIAYTCLRQPDGSFAPPQRLCVRNADGTGFSVFSTTLAEDFGPAWSRDGSQIAFTTFNPGFQSSIATIFSDGSGRGSIAIFPGAANPDWSADGWSLVFELGNSIWAYNRIFGNSARLTNLTGDTRPRYSPDGSRIVFQSGRDGQSEIYVMNADGTGQTRLTNNPASDTAPAWSPDGSKILFTTLRDDPNKPALYLMNADGGNPTKVTDGSDGAWRPIPIAPVIFTEENTTNAAAINAVTFVRGPFKLLDPNNFSADGRTRITIFTSNVGFIPLPNPPPFWLSVKANGVELPVEYVGSPSGVQGMNSSYIVVRLPAGLPTGDLSLTVTLRGLTSEAKTLRIAP